ncbi:MAG: GspH/FimT family protein [Gammaproteobacteria bacterium]
MAARIIHASDSAISSGFTLLELLITLLMLSLLLGIALPDFHELVQQKQSDITIRTLTTALELARTSAITDNSLSTLCRSSDGSECGGNWEDGILVFTDHNGNRKIDTEDRLIRHFPSPGSTGKLYWRAFQNRQYLQFTPQGFTRYQNGNFTFCPHSKDLSLARQIILNRSARIRHAQDSDGDGIREDSRGRPIRCD